MITTILAYIIVGFIYTGVFFIIPASLILLFICDH